MGMKRIKKNIYKLITSSWKKKKPPTRAFLGLDVLWLSTPSAPASRAHLLSLIEASAHLGPLALVDSCWRSSTREKKPFFSSSLSEPTFMDCPSFNNVTFPGVPRCDNVPSLKEVLAVLEVPEDVLLAVYPYGSHIMGVSSPQSGTSPSLPKTTQ